MTKMFYNLGFLNIIRLLRMGGGGGALSAENGNVIKGDAIG